jgi:short-subunit dehydrogenase
MSLAGRRALITGAAGKLGGVMASTLAELGANLVLVDRPGSNFDSIIEELKVHWSMTPDIIECDLENENDRLSLIDEVRADHRGLNILINNAAFVGSSELQGWVAPFEEQTLETWRRAIEVNLTAAFHLSQAFMPTLSKAEGGRNEYG